jgi:hypothetical protein
MSGEQEWRDIGDGTYQVSNDGCVRRVKTGRVLKQGPNSNGYLTVCPYADGKQNTRTVHRLVAEGFVPNPDNKPEVDHIDRNKLNNHMSNLRWVTRSENNINTAGRSNTGFKHICRKRNSGKPVFYVAIERGGKVVVSKRFYIKDRDEAEVLAEADAYRREKYSELGIEVID